MTEVLPRRFALHRLDDESGVSGTGIVAEGVEFSDGTAALRWRTEHRSTAIYASVLELKAIHGHGGKTRVHWIDGEPLPDEPTGLAAGPVHEPAYCERITWTEADEAEAKRRPIPGFGEPVCVWCGHEPGSRECAEHPAHAPAGQTGGPT